MKEMGKESIEGGWENNASMAILYQSSLACFSYITHAISTSQMLNLDDMYTFYLILHDVFVCMLHFQGVIQPSKP